MPDWAREPGARPIAVRWRSPQVRGEAALVAVAQLVRAEAARLVRLVADAYAMAERSAPVDTILWWQDRCWRGIEAGAEAGEPTMIRLRDLGAAAPGTRAIPLDRHPPADAAGS